MNLRLVSVLVLAALLVAPGLAAARMAIRAEYTVATDYEIGETNRNEYNGLGQRNCLDAAPVLDRPVPGCGFEITGETWPLVGVRVLDAVIFGAGLSDPSGDVHAILSDPAANASAPVNDAKRGTNPHRASAGATNDVILPGRGQLWAWYGRWHDLDEDGAIDVAIVSGGPRPRNEWSPDETETLVAYLEPGSHPSFTNLHRPEETAPDAYLLYEWEEGAHNSGGDAAVRVSGNTEAGIPYTVFLAGSLFEAITVTTVSDAIFAPGPEGRPYVARASSLVDVDRYAVLGPSVVGDLYAGVLAAPVGPFVTPSLGYCPNACRAEPVSFVNTPLEGPAHGAMGGVFANYTQEWREGSESTNAGRRAEYLDGFQDWIDLHPRWSPVGGGPATRSSPLPGRSSDGSQAMMPGVLSVEVRLGLWMDLDGDGYIGTARPGDPHHGGSRPIADDYERTGGEFYGTNALYKGTMAPAQSFAVFLVPESTWGDGVTLLDFNGLPTTTYSGSETIKIAAARDENVGGLYTAWSSVLMPSGSPAFKVCTDRIEMVRGASEERVFLQDCDAIGAWDLGGGRL